jgi:phosphatidylserine/phosphatidylglycerophosphate/cardiolipin synthase-like enzyme
MRQVSQRMHRVIALAVLAAVIPLASPLYAWAPSTTLDANPIERVREAIERARARVDIAVYKLEERSVRGALADAIERGVAVRIVADAREALSRESEIEWLARRGARVRVWNRGKLHVKLILIDGAIAMQSSANLTESAQHDNVELTMVSRAPDDIAAMQRIFDELWEQAAPERDEDGD